MGKTIDYLMDLFYPSRCMFCRRDIAPGPPGLCAACQESVTPPENTHGAYFSVCVSALTFQDEAAKAIRRFKFGNCSCYAHGFGELIAERIYSELWGEFDLITWSPVSPDRLRRRGYDQARLLAEDAAQRLRQPVKSTLKKKKRVPQQSLIKSSEARKANILGAYSAPEPSVVAGKKILLIDDIVTSGATLSECSKTLLTAGAERVLCCTLAKTPKITPR